MHEKALSVGVGSKMLCWSGLGGHAILLYSLQEFLLLTNCQIQ